MNAHALPELAERPGLGGRLVRRTVAIALVVVLVLAAAGLALLFCVQIDVTVEARGALEPLRVWRVHSFASGVIHEVRAVPGARVERGEILARLDRFALETELESLQLEARHKRHRRDASRTEVERLERAIETAEKRLLRLTILAPEGGVVLSEEVDRLLGQHVDAGRLLFEIGSAKSWKAVLEVPEREIDPIRVGDPVKLTIPAVADSGSWLPESLPAAVTFIGSEPTATSTPRRSRYRIHAELDATAVDAERSARFRRGMSAEARVVTRSARAIDLLWRHLQRQVEADG